MADKITRRSLLTGAASVVGWVAATSAQAKSIAFIAGHAVTPPGNTVNFVTDFGAVPGGGAGTSDAAIAAFNAYFATATGDVTLFIPTGTYSTSQGTSQWFASTASTADSLTISGYGATFNNSVYFGHFVTFDNNTHQARCQSVDAGSTTIQLTTLADHPLFNVGDWALMTGLDLQGGGSPPNPQWHEYVQIIAKDTGTGVCILTLSDPLDNTYLSTWPHYASGSAFAPDQGGPATLYAIDQTWDLDFFCNGVTFAGTENIQYTKFRHVEYLECTWPVSSLGPVPTATFYFKYDSCTINSVTIEADKLVTTYEIVDTTFLHGIGFQSASVTNFIMSGSTVTGVLDGNGGGDTSISDSSIPASWALAPYAYGACLGSHTLTNVVGPSVLSNPTGTTGATFATSLYTHTGSGVFTIAKASGPQGWAVPSARIIVSGSNGTITQFTVMDVAESGSNTVITTDLGGAFPSAPSGWGASVLLSCRATNSIVASGLSGSDQLTNLNNPGAQGLPLNSYLKKTLQNSFSPGAEQYCNGKMVSFSINVTLAYAGATSTVKITPNQFHTFGTLDSTYAAYDFTPSINAKVAGARVFRPGGVTGTQSGDTSMTAPPTPAPWMSKSIAPFLSASVADGTLTVVFEVIYDQNADAINATVQNVGYFANTAFGLDAKLYYTPGNESPAVSTADYYHTHACEYLAPYDLDAMGSPGAAVKAANGNNRYVWFISPEHPAGGAGIPRDATGFKMGFSNDPGILPAYAIDVIPQNNQFVGSVSIPNTNGFTLSSDFAASSLVYNPDDVSFPFYLYTQGAPLPPGQTYQTQSIMWKSADMLHWQGGGWSPKAFATQAGIIPQTSPSHLTSLQRVTRRGTGDWVSFGNVGEVARTGFGIWTGTNGTDFAWPSTIYNYSGYSSVALTLSGTTLTAASSIFASTDVGKAVAIVYSSGNSVLAAVGGTTPTYIAAYVSPTQVTLNANASATLSAQTLPFQFGTYSVMTAPGLDPLGGTSNYNPTAVGPTVTIGRQDYTMLTEDARHAFQSNDDGMHATLAPTDSGLSIRQTIPVKRLASYSGVYTGPGYPIAVLGYYEDGILHSYAELGYPGPFGANPYPFVGAGVTGGIVGTVLTVTAIAGGFITIGAIVYGTGGFTDYVGQITAQTVGTPGSTGTYTVENDGSKSYAPGSSLKVNSGTNYNVDSVAAAGGFRQQFIQYITSVTDDNLASKAAPFGVVASCSSNTVTISWMLQACRSGAPAQTYHVYRGTTLGTQATSIGTTASSSITDTPTPGSVYYYRVVKISGGIEQTTKYRIVHTYVG